MAFVSLNGGADSRHMMSSRAVHELWLHEVSDGPCLKCLSEVVAQ